MIGVGIITYNREKLFKNLISSLPKADVCVVINDGTPYESYPKGFHVIEHENNKGVGAAKNSALKYLIEKGCEHLFLIEDDMLITREDIFDEYIKLSEEADFKHLNFGFHGRANRKGTDYDGEYSPMSVDTINGVKFFVNKNIVGSFSYYRKEIIEEVGYMDEDFYNGVEHVEHTYRITKHENRYPFWRFPDIFESYKYIKEQEDCRNSVIGKDKKLQEKNNRLFRNKHGISIVEIPIK